MTRRHPWLRLAGDVLVGLLATSGFALSSKSEKTGPYILAVSACLIVWWAFRAGYREASARWVWAHGPLLLLPELVALPVALLTCRGFECAGVIGFLMAASLFSLVLMVLSYVGFFVQRRTARARAE